LVCGLLHAFFLRDTWFMVYGTPFFLRDTWHLVHGPFKPCALAAAHISFRSPSANNYKASISGEFSMCHDHHYFVVAALSFICLVLTLPAHRFV
jgi:hypothetical protein